MSTRFDHILFDADNTLFDYDRAEGEALAATFAAYGHGFDAAVHARYRAINQSLWAAKERGEIATGVLTVERFRRLFAELGLTQKPEVFNTCYLDALADGVQLIDGAYEVCETLARAHTLSIVTNGVPRTQRRRVERSAIRPFFAHLFISGEIGHKKPDIEYFEHVFRELGGVDRARTLIVGDSLTSDIQGGINAGIATCWFNPSGAPNATDMQPDHEIRALMDLLSIIV